MRFFIIQKNSPVTSRAFSCKQSKEIAMNEVMLSQDLVFVDQNVAYTDSRTVAKVFNRAHRNVLIDIKRVINEIESFGGEQHFLLSSYKTKQNKDAPRYLINRDDFLILVMGYTGALATEIRYRYIQAFNEMANQLGYFDQYQSLLVFEKNAKEKASKCGFGLNEWKHLIPEIAHKKRMLIGKFQPDWIDQLDKKQIH